MHAGWWTVMTMTTVGYGDILPRTTSGALLGYVTMLTGMLSVALPISVLSSTFASKYEQFTKDSKVRYLCPDRGLRTPPHEPWNINLLDSQYTFVKSSKALDGNSQMLAMT
jgi:hypothetical protein